MSLYSVDEDGVIFAIHSYLSLFLILIDVFCNISCMALYFSFLPSITAFPFSLQLLYDSYLLFFIYF